MERIYLCIDLKSFYASVECVERGLDPFSINLVVADPTRHGAITLAATPAIKKLGVPSRGRIYEIDSSIDYIIAPPRMALYMQYAAKIYGILLKFISSEDIYVYSIDESFLDITSYLKLYQKSPKEIAKMMIDQIVEETGITATAGIGTNLFLAKVALDICAKHALDFMGYLDEDIFRQTLWDHKPLTDIWMIGPGTTKHLARLGLYDLYDVAHYPEGLLYKEFGVNAATLIDHAWGKEETTIPDIKAYQPKQNSISNSQILFEDYTYEDAFLIMEEMVETNVLVLTEKKVVTNQIALFVGYSKDCAKPTRASTKITNTTNLYSILLKEFSLLYQRSVRKNVPIRQIAISFLHIQPQEKEMYDLFTSFQRVEKEKRIQNTLVQIKNKYGKNAILKGMNVCDKSMAKVRNTLIGGHNA